ncbi:MAG: chloride channel protein [Acidobacteriota bacterium]
MSALSQWLDRRQPSASVVQAIAASAVGLLAGAGVRLFRWLIEEVRELWSAGLTPLGPGWSTALVPALGGVIVGLLLLWLVGEERHHGVAGIIEAVALAGGRLRYRRMPAKAVAAAISLGSGASVGPEDPSVQIGSNLGSMLGQWLRLSDDRMRVLVAGGAAAGMAAAFNAPIAGVFFALEIVLGEVAGSAVGPVVLSAVVSAAFTQAVAGKQPAFAVPAYDFRSAWELPLYLGLGLAAGPVSALYVRLLYLSQDLFHRLRLPRWLKPALAGAAVGLAALALPQVLGEGYVTIESILGSRTQTVGLLLALLAAKIVLTPLCIGAGFPGGVFAPSLFLGATLGGAFGLAADRLFPGLTLDPQAFAMVGMAAMLAGAVHAPLTAILLLFEMTNDYRIILPLMFAVMVSQWASQRLQSDSVYTLSLARKGLRIERGRDVEVLESLTVGEVMERDAPVLRGADPLAGAAEVMAARRFNGLAVLNAAGRLAGILTRQDLDRGKAAGLATVGDACTREVLVAYEDESLAEALRRMSVRDIGRLPVVSRDDPGRLLGLLRRHALTRAYDAALTRQAELRHRAQRVRLGTVGGVEVEEIEVEAGAPCDGLAVRDLGWPPGAVLATLRRGARVMIPRADTVLLAGDVLAVLAEGAAREAVVRSCRRG